MKKLILTILVIATLMGSVTIGAEIAPKYEVIASCYDVVNGKFHGNITVERPIDGGVIDIAVNDRSMFIDLSNRDAISSLQVARLWHSATPAK